MLNQIFKVIFNQSLGRLVVVSELAKNKCKVSQTNSTNPKQSHNKHLFKLTAIALFLVDLVSVPAWAHVTDVSGDYSVNQPTKSISFQDERVAPPTLTDPTPASIEVGTKTVNGITTITKKTDTSGNTTTYTVIGKNSSDTIVSDKTVQVTTTTQNEDTNTTTTTTTVVTTDNTANPKTVTTQTIKVTKDANNKILATSTTERLDKLTTAADDATTTTPVSETTVEKALTNTGGITTTTTEKEAKTTTNNNGASTTALATTQTTVVSEEQDTNGNIITTTTVTVPPASNTDPTVTTETQVASGHSRTETSQSVEMADNRSTTTTTTTSTPVVGATSPEVVEVKETTSTNKTRTDTAQSLVMKSLTTEKTTVTRSTKSDTNSYTSRLSYSGDKLELSLDKGLELGEYATTGGRDVASHKEVYNPIISLSKSGLQFYDQTVQDLPYTSAGLLSASANGETLQWNGTGGLTLTSGRSGSRSTPPSGTLSVAYASISRPPSDPSGAPNNTGSILSWSDFTGGMGFLGSTATSAATPFTKYMGGSLATVGAPWANTRSTIPRTTNNPDGIVSPTYGWGDSDYYVDIPNTPMSTIVNANGLHLGYGDTEKATVTLINPAASLRNVLYRVTIKGNKFDSSTEDNNGYYSSIFATAGNGGTGTVGVPKDGSNNKKGQNGDIFITSDASVKGLGLLVGSMAAGSETKNWRSYGGFGIGVFMGLNNGLVPREISQPSIFKDLGTPISSGPEAERAGAVVYGAYNTVNGNGALALGMLNRIYGNGGIAIGNASLADAYTSAGRFGISMGFNVKAGEWANQQTVIGANIQAVGTGNIILGGGNNKYYGYSSYTGWKDDQVDTMTGIYSNVGNVFTVTTPVKSGKSDGIETLNTSGMRFWGDRNIVLGAQNRTEGFNPNVGDTNSGYTGSFGTGGYKRIADNAVVGAKNTIRDLSFRNTVSGAENIVTSGNDNMILGSSNEIQAALGVDSNSNYTNGTVNAYKPIEGIVKAGENNKGELIYEVIHTTETAEKARANLISQLYKVAVSGDKQQNKTNLLTSDQTTIVGSNNKVQYGTNNNFIAGSSNVVNFKTIGNFVAGANNQVSYQTSGSFISGSNNKIGYNVTDQNGTVTITDPTQLSANDIVTLFTPVDNYKKDAGGKILKTKTPEEIAAEEAARYVTQGNTLMGSNITIGVGAQNNMLLGNRINVLNDVKGSYVLGSNVDVKANNSVYFGSKSVAILNSTTVSGTTLESGQKVDDLSLKALNEYITAGEMGQTSITINGKKYDFAGLGEIGGGVITVGRIVNEGSASNPDYVSYGRIIQNVAPGLIGAKSTDAVNGSQLYAIRDSIEATVNQIVSGEQGPVVYTDAAGNRLIKENNVLYQSALVNGYRQAVDGLWYKDDDFITNRDGTYSLRNAKNPNGKTLATLDYSKGYVKIGDLWYEDNPEVVKYDRDGVPSLVNEQTEGLSEDNLKSTVKSSVFDPANAVLSLVNAEKQASGDATVQKASTKTTTVLQNLTAALKVDSASSDPVARQNSVATLIGLKTDTDERKLTQAATVKDLQTLAIAGMDFAGNDDSAKNLVHRNLGEKLTIKGDAPEAGFASDFASAQGNIRVVKDTTTDANGLVIQLAKKLTNLTSATFTDESNNTTTINSAGVTITPAGNDANPVSITNTGISAGGNSITNVADNPQQGTDAANKNYVDSKVGNASWSIASQTGSATTPTSEGAVNAGDTVNFKDGTGSTVKVEAKTEQNKPDAFTVSYDVNQSTLSVSNGEITNDATVGTTTFATAENVKSTITTAVTGAKTKVSLDETDDSGILELAKTESTTNLNANTYALKVNQTKLVDALSDDFAAKSLESNTIKLTGNNTTSTHAGIALNNANGISFAITGDGTDLSTTASATGVSIALNKSTEVKKDDNQVITSDAVNTAITNLNTVYTPLTRAITLTDSANNKTTSQTLANDINFTLTGDTDGTGSQGTIETTANGTSIKMKVKAGSIGTTQLDTDVNTAISNANSAVQSFTVGAGSETAGITVDKTNSRFDIVGDANITTGVSGRNISVVLNKTIDLTSEGSITVGGTVITDKSVQAGDNTFTDDGLTIKDGPSVTTTGIDAGNKAITNVATVLSNNALDSTKKTNAINAGDAETLVNNSAWNIKLNTGTAGDKDIGTVNNKDSVVFKDGTGTTASVTKDGTDSETYSVVFNVNKGTIGKTTGGDYEVTTGDTANSFVSSGDLVTVLNELKTSIATTDAKTFGLAPATGTAVTANLGNTISVIGADTNITTLSGNSALKIKLNSAVVLGDGTANGSLEVKNAGTSGSIAGVKLAGGQITFTSNEGGSAYQSLVLKSILNGDKLLDSKQNNDPRLSFNGNQLATMKDGMSFHGDMNSSGASNGDGSAFNLALNKQLKLYGNYNDTLTNLTTGNIAVVSNGSDTLTLKLAKNLRDMNSIGFGTTTIGSGSSPTVLMKLQAAPASTSSPILNLVGANNTAVRINGVATDTLKYGYKQQGQDQVQYFDKTLSPEEIKTEFSDPNLVSFVGKKFATKADDDAASIGDLKAYSDEATRVIDGNINNLRYGLRTRNDTSSFDYAYSPLGSTAGEGNTILVTGTNITAKASGNESNPTLDLSLNKDIVLGDNNGNGATITLNGDQAHEQILLDANNSKIDIKNGDRERITLDGVDGTIKFTDKDGATTNSIGLSNDKTADLEGNQTNRLTTGDTPVATMKDGLKFAGNSTDSADIIKRKLNEQLQVKGGMIVDKTNIAKDTTDANTYVDVDTLSKALIVKLARDLTGLRSATFETIKDDGTVDTSKPQTTINGDGITITKSAADTNKSVSLTEEGLDNGGNTIKGITSVMNDTTTGGGGVEWYAKW
ncbi:ESPR-type extended signal peptide-containing protein [Gallibacterium melopsittaci]|uniref:ESPR-type extended signal peptide-containing protein n=1 Tax=Gallibacterium melopsittaci TaxID=516063 RepID=A0ABV6HTF6_9PAST